MAVAHCLSDDLRFCRSPTNNYPDNILLTNGKQLVIGLVFGVPESPRWLYKHGKNQEALDILCQVYDRSPDHPKIVKEQNDVLNALQLEQEHGEYKWSQLFKRDDVQTGRRVLLAYGMQFMNQMGGINLIV